MIKLSNPNPHGTYQVYYENNSYMGEFIIKEDGYYDWWPDQKLGQGYIPSYLLRALADKLDELNKEWDEQIRSDPNI